MDYQEYSETLKALGHPIRLKMVEGLMKHSCHVNQMVEALNLPQSTVSQHLGILKNCGIIVPRKDGVQTCYEVTDKKVKQIIKILSKAS